MEELITVRRFLSDLCADDGAALASKADAKDEESTGLSEEQIRYILEDFSPGLIRKMCREGSQDDVVSIFYLDSFNKINQCILFLLVPGSVRWRVGRIFEPHAHRAEERPL